jgi:CcmD family protein
MASLKRTVRAILPTFVLLVALAMISEPSRALAAPAASQMATAPGMKATAPGMKGDEKPGQWRDYDPAKARGSGGQGGQVPSGTLVVFAYIIIWAVMFLYVLVLAFRQKRLKGEVEQLRRRLDEVEPPARAVDPMKT